MIGVLIAPFILKACRTVANFLVFNNGNISAATSGVVCIIWCHNQFSSLGILTDTHTSFTGEDYGTGETVSWGWRLAGLLPFASEFRNTNKLASIVKRDKTLLKLAKETFEGNNPLRTEANALIEQLGKGNMNPGIGSKKVFGNVFEARGRNGARVYFQNSGNSITIVGYSNKANQQTVINRLQELHGK